MSTEKVRVRFAPSPTGPLHIGGLRTALYNYLFAKKNGGTFILRIEDTDQNRYVEGAEEYIKQSLNWCNIPYDEGPDKDGEYGPYRQSERKALYKTYADLLIEKGSAYYAFDTPEELDNHRAQHEQQGKTFIYNAHNRMKLNNSLALSHPEVEELKQTTPYVIRFKTPENERLKFKDEIRGSIEIDTSTLDDKVLFKSDGMPTYHLANIVDDHLMKITHVIRGEEWLPSLGLHVLLYRAFDWKAPLFAHLPLILKPYGQGKLSKRDGDKFGFPVFPLEWTDPKTGEVSTGYKQKGYFPEALINMLSLLGWNEGGGSEQEIYNLTELQKAFSLQHVSKGGSKFDPEKTLWFQHYYMQHTEDSKLADQLDHFLKNKGLQLSKEYIQQIIPLLKDRITFIQDFWDQGLYFFQAPKEYEAKAAKKAWKEDTSEIMDQVISIIKNLKDFNAEGFQEALKNWISRKELGFGKVMQPLRLSLVGSMQGPDIFKIAELIGKEETIERLERAVKSL